MTANYLYLAADCPYGEANAVNLSTWRKHGPYTVVTTTKSRLSRDLVRTAEEFGGRTATTPKKLLVENVLQSVQASKPDGDDFRYFIEPELNYSDSLTLGKPPIPALTHFVKILVEDGRSNVDGVCAEILLAPAGQGKTTLCRAIANKIRLTNPDIIPVLVESSQWQQLLELTLSNVLNAALLQMIPGATHLTNPRVFQMLVRESILVPIFDGFDELSLHPNANFSAATLLEELVELVGGAEARILVTARDAFWDRHFNSIPETVAQKIQLCKLQGFSNNQRRQFFQKRLNLPEERDIANRLSREIGSRLYEGAVNRPTMQADRASGVPLMLELIALYVDGNPSATFVPESRDPLGPLLESVCERENERQKLDISAQKQMLIFENLFRDYPDEIPREYLVLYVEDAVTGVTQDILGRFESHAFLTIGSIGNVAPRFETLRVYFVARWLANQLAGFILDGQVR